MLEMRIRGFNLKDVLGCEWEDLGPEGDRDPCGECEAVSLGLGVTEDE